MHANRLGEAQPGTPFLAALCAALVLLVSACAADSGATDSGGGPPNDEPDAQVSVGGRGGYACLGRRGYSCASGVVSEWLVGFVASAQPSGPCSRAVHVCRSGYRLGLEPAVDAAAPAMLCAESVADAGDIDAGNTDADAAAP